MLTNPSEYKGAYYVLTNDIDLTGKTWMPISSYNRSTHTEEKWFAGTFDGNGYTISGITDDKVGELVYDQFVGSNKSTVVNANGEYSFGLFGSVNGATLKNINLTNVNIKGESIPVEDKVYVADSVGALVGASKGATTVFNVTVAGSINATDAAAGVVGRVYVEDNAVSFDHCINEANVSGKVVSNSHAVAAGICRAYNRTTGTITITNCINTGVITTENETPYVGGIAIITKHKTDGYSYCVQSENVDAGKSVAFINVTGTSDSVALTAVAE